MTTPVRVLAVDLGTSSVRAMVVDARAVPVAGALARQEIEPRQRDDGSAEVDAPTYVEALAGCLDQLSGRGALAGVRLVATASQWHSVLAVDADDPTRPLSPVLPWLDTRARPPRQPADPDAFHSRTGAWPHTLYWTAKIPWLRERLAVPARFVGLPDHVRAVLLDSDATSLSLASGAGVLDLRAGGWDAEALELTGVRADQLPDLTDEPGRLAARWRDRWPDLVDVPWHPVLGDGAASNLGSGCSTPDVLAVTVGTSAALRVVHGEDVADPPWEVWRYRVDGRRLVSGIASSAGGVLYGWVSDLLRLGADAEPSVAPGDHGLVSVPLHAGSRPPHDVPAGSGMLAGLSLNTTADEILAATLEGVALEIARAVAVVESGIGRRLDVVLGGGAIEASPWWQRAIAAALERPVHVADDPEVGARGAAAHALGIDLPRPAATCSPDPGDVRRMSGRRKHYAAVRDTVR